MNEHEQTPNAGQPAGPADGDHAATEPRVDDGPPRSRTRYVLAALAALAVALFTVPLLRGPESPVAQQDGNEASGACAARGQANLDFTLTDINGAQVRLADYKGKVILLNFWATWCGPCKIEIPDFVEIYDQYRDQGLEILGVLNLDDPSPDQLRAFASEYKMNYPVFRADDDFADANGPIWGLPTTLVIDRQGSICARHMGMVRKETVERDIRGLL